VKVLGQGQVASSTQTRTHARTSFNLPSRAAAELGGHKSDTPLTRATTGVLDYADPLRPLHFRVLPFGTHEHANDDNIVPARNQIRFMPTGAATLAGVAVRNGRASLAPFCQRWASR
jgi:hypothetical protein